MPTSRRTEFLKELSHLLSYAEHIGIDLIITSFHRTAKQQVELYAIGRTKEKNRKIVTKADGVNKKSKHQDWEAVDLCIAIDGKLEWEWTEDYNLLGKFWKRKGHTWGGEWALGDIYHFQL